MQETVISDAVNLASRVEGLTRILGVDVLVSEATAQRLAAPKDFTLRFLGKVAVKGRKEATSVFELVLGEDQGARKRNRGDFEAGLEAYFTRRFGEAVGRFSKVVQNDARDKAAALYLQRSAIFMGTPPGKDWDGVERLTEK
jgi:two-component system sensor histidine kinase ChiS